jgi:hypothetical protein
MPWVKNVGKKKIRIKIKTNGLAKKSLFSEASKK